MDILKKNSTSKAPVLLSLGSRNNTILKLINIFLNYKFKNIN